MQPGEIQRWRFIHGGVRETLFLAVPGGGPLNEIATDGNTTGRIDAWKANLEFDPGYRSDILYQAPALPAGKTSMTYYLTSAAVSGARSLQVRLPAMKQRNLKAMAFLSTVIQPPGTIAVIEVSGAPVTMAMPTAAELAPLEPYKPITDAELTGTPQNMEFSIENVDCSGSGPCQFCPPGKNCSSVGFMVNRFEYPNGPVRQMQLGTASVWHLSVASASLAPEHPFHIHVNPFEMVRPGPDGKPQTVWKDTLLVHADNPVTVKSRYEDFTGAFVLHCHILDHEDQGMMQKVEIVN